MKLKYHTIYKCIEKKLVSYRTFLYIYIERKLKLYWSVEPTKDTDNEDDITTRPRKRSSDWISRIVGSPKVQSLLFEIIKDNIYGK